MYRNASRSTSQPRSGIDTKNTAMTVFFLLFSHTMPSKGINRQSHCNKFLHTALLGILTLFWVYSKRAISTWFPQKFYTFKNCIFLFYNGTEGKSGVCSEYGYMPCMRYTCIPNILLLSGSVRQ